MKNNITNKGNISNNIFSPVSSDEVQKRLQKLNPRKAIGNDKIPPVLIKVAVACVKPLYKKTENKHYISKNL